MDAAYLEPGSRRSQKGSSGRLRRVSLATTDLDLRTLRPLGAAMLGLGALLPHLPGNPGLPCPLRTITGVPCPFCGCTTSVEAAMHGHPMAALAASPLGLLIVAFALLLLVRPRWSRTRIWLGPLVAMAGLSWVFELARFGFL